MSFPRCRGVLGPPWVPLPGCPGPPWVALPVLPGPLRCAEAFCQSFLAIPGGFPRASWPLAGAALFAWVSWPGFPCRALPVHPGPVTGASWPPVTLPGLLFLAFARRPKPGNTMVAILLINSFCGSKGNGPFLTKSWPKPFCQPKPGHMKLCFYTPRAYRCKTQARSRAGVLPRPAAGIQILWRFLAFFAFPHKKTCRTAGPVATQSAR